ncbi:type II toxin-antitoxin system PemK/MazF family toxin [Actinomyces oris]|uniref:type II toxin-antitoxin system PemK/MazF family toxin n=1 Tax=Actinomyces oris TaxID=544580 RepID=UPI0028D0DADC|nr:type II toxin-antitoxin system PemK/MazF family toxin [Actinomyces oris]
MELAAPVEPGEVWWALPDPAVGREQSGRRPVLIVSNERFHRTVMTLVVVVPVTTKDWGWPNHVELNAGAGMEQRSFAMTEQVRTISRQRLTKKIGIVGESVLRDVREWLVDYLR